MMVDWNEMVIDFIFALLVIIAMTFIFLILLKGG